MLFSFGYGILIPYVEMLYISYGGVEMPLAASERVELPKGIVRARKGDNIYIQYIVRAYRNEKGKPTNDRVCIGKLDQETGKLIPNARYYELFEKRQPIAMPEYVRRCGSYAVFNGVAKQLGLYALVKKHFPDCYHEIMTVAHYMLCEGNVMYYLPDWQEETVSFSKEILNGTSLSRLFTSIDGKRRIEFFNDWTKKKLTGEFLAYDVTSISSYSKGIESLEWGYNRDKENLPQLNMGMYYGEDSALPLYYRLYPGSIPDKAHLRYMAEDTGVISCKKAKFVMDRGFYSADNLQYLTDKGCCFVIALPGSLKYVKELIEKHGAEIINRSEYKLGADMLYGKAYEVTELGFRMRVHLYYDPLKAANDSSALFREIEKQEAELREMKEAPDRKLHYDKYFYINVSSKDGSLSFKRNADAIDAALRQCGYFVIADTDFKKTSAEILCIYRRRDVIEKSFDNLKNELDMNRLHIHSEAAAEGKTFVAFLALVIRSQLLRQLSEVMERGQITLRKVFAELDKVKLIISANSVSGARLLNPPTRLQKDILSALYLPLNSFDLLS